MVYFSKRQYLKKYVSVHGTLKLENRNREFGFHAFVLLMNALNFGPSFSTITLHVFFRVWLK